jgi:hypothetical protein
MEQDRWAPVSLLYFEDCPNWQEGQIRMRQALEQLGRADVEIVPVLVGTDAEAIAIGFAGSPTFMIDGQDLFGPAPAVGGLACRVYRTATGLSGVPEVAELVAALRAKVS